jgi:antigen flippase
LRSYQNDAPGDDKKSYGQILKSTTLIGGSSVIVVFLKIIQAKAMAVLLGPAGVGIIGLYGSVTGVVGQITGMGIGISGVRQIAESAESDDKHRISRTIVTVRRVAVFLGVVGMLVLLLFRYPICQITFGNTNNTDALALLSVTLLMGAISGGQVALIQGLRRIGDLARLNILGAFFGTVCSIPLVYFFGKLGIAPFLVAVSAMGILTSWWYARKIPIPNVLISWREITSEGRALFRLGIAFMSAGLMTLGTMYCIRVIVVRQLGLEAAGLFQASSAISGLYVGFILSAMGADFYPRLTAVANDNAACNRMVNEQAEVGLLLAVPGILATLTFAPYVIQIFYSVQFAPAMDILRWEILGILLRVASWPMGFVLLAKGRGRIFFCTELSGNIVYIGMVFALLRYFGLPGTGMAFFGLYVFYWILIFAVVRRLSGFTWSAANQRLIVIVIPSTIVVVLCLHLMPEVWSTAVGTVVTLATGYNFLKKLFKAVGPDKVREVILSLKAKFRLT